MTLESFKPSYLEIEPSELVHFLLNESGQYDRGAVNPSDLLGFMKLDFLRFDFNKKLPEQARPRGSRPRALLSFPDRIIAVDSSLSRSRARFSVLHEIAHYVLPSHQHSVYLCNSLGMSPGAKLTFEKEANEFAADLLFKGRAFAADAARMELSVETIAALRGRYQASFEATARHLVEKSHRPAMLVVFKVADDASQIDVDGHPSWKVRYCAASPTFKNRFFSTIRGNAPPDVASELLAPSRDISESVYREIDLPCGPGKRCRFRGEFFSNKHNILCLLLPAQE